ncbi:cytochrome P450 [Nocardia tenerifensis]|uniref:Cytochrome P450 n=1 Tax=Nocardia tenerifensis TaxID=228006 RepID=A0A318KF38_9NOCA|nr:cytochrome P450 [Nocardia tenerifensis]PXX71565.1 cytochrome P450 [Nocardia tenerifensis]
MAEPSSREADLAAAFMAIYGNPELSSDPQTMYRRHRAAGDTTRIGPMVVVHPRALVEEALDRPAEFSSAMSSARLGNTRPLIPMQLDPPAHGAYRKAIRRLFTAGRLRPMTPAIIRIAESLIDRLGDRAEVDFATEFAVPLPALVLLELLGLPARDAALLIALKDAIVHPPWGDPAETERSQAEAGARLYQYFAAVLDDEAVRARGGLIADLLGTDVGQRRLTAEEIADICYLLILAGLDTVTDTLTLSAAYLAQHPERRRELVDDPALTDHAVEELLRWETPVPGLPRLVTTETRIGDCPVRPGEVLFLSLGSANTDEAALPDAYTVRFDRPRNPHLAFGGGIHRCLGGYLAKLELSIALRVWHTRFPDYAIPGGTTIEYATGLRSIPHLPLTLPARPQS